MGEAGSVCVCVRVLEGKAWETGILSLGRSTGPLHKTLQLHGALTSMTAVSSQIETESRAAAISPEKSETFE